MEPKKTTTGATPSSSGEIPSETLQMAMALQALPESERRFLAAFLTGSSAASSAAPTPTLEKPETKEKAGEKPPREGTEQVSVGGTVTKAMAEPGVLTSSNEQEKEGAVSATMVAEPAEDIPAATSARLVEHLRAVPFATPSAETEKSSGPRRDETESAGINLETDFLTDILQEPETEEKKRTESDMETESDGESLVRRRRKAGKYRRADGDRHQPTPTGTPNQQEEEEAAPYETEPEDIA
ncbi:hypothetical protein M569_15284 [Genlisea aurea]|uniref:Uncharacterized protein n=1 Tax=Genlisea aurea TaxID=192259 RepID=S8C520_9LAMI|nr:hypothetical protein M569_15284 [Genlisea aurea]